MYVTDNEFFLNFIAEKGDTYNSRAQKARVLTEDWVNRQIYCPACGSLLKKASNNAPVLDFVCCSCSEQFELKSSKKEIASKVVDGAYQKMIERLNGDEQPNLFFLHYNAIRLEVLNFFAVPKHFLIPQFIQKRKPLSASARRAGWIGCNILLNQIPQSGRIFIIKDKTVTPKERVMNNWSKTVFLRQAQDFETRGWLVEIMNCIDKLGKREFVLNDIYRFETELAEKFPQNQHIRDKIRQKLQILRDKNYLRFISQGQYQLV